MARRDIDPERFVTAAAEVMGVEITDAYRPGVVRNFRNFMDLYGAVQGFDEPEAKEPPSVYRP